MKDIKQGVEDLGVAFERLGRTPIVSRVFSYLLLADPAHKSFDEIIEFLGASKSAVSNALTALQAEGLVTYVTFSGDRKRYFKVDTKAWMQSMINSSKNLTAFNNMLEEAIDYRSAYEDKKMSEEIKELLKFQIFLYQKVELAINEWQTKFSNK